MGLMVSACSPQTAQTAEEIIETEEIEKNETSDKTALQLNEPVNYEDWEFTLTNVEFADEFIRGGLTEVLGDDHAVHVQTERAQLIDLPQNVGTVGNAEIGADFVAFQICRADDEDDLRLIFEGQEHFAFGVRLESRQNARGVHIVEQFSAEFEIQLIVELLNAFEYLFALQSDI